MLALLALTPENCFTKAHLQNLNLRTNLRIEYNLNSLIKNNQTLLFFVLIVLNPAFDCVTLSAA